MSDPSPAEPRPTHSDAKPTFRQRRRARLARRSTVRRRLERSGIALFLLVVAIAGSVVGYVINSLDEIHHVRVNDLAQTKGGVENILLVGSTSRCAVQNAPHLGAFVQECEEGVDGVNSDVTMVLHLDPNTHRVSLLSIPRDTFVPNSRVDDNANRIDAALADGPTQLIAAIEEDFGIPINHYVVLNFGSFASIVTALGGIHMFFPTEVKDLSGLDVNRIGCIRISGLEALALVRARHMYYDYDKKTGQWLGYDGSGDLGRIERDHIFLKVLANDLETRGLGSPTTDASLLSAIAPQLTVDSTLGSSAILSLVQQFRHVVPNDTPEYTVPIVEDTQELEYMGLPYGDVVFPSEPQDQITIDRFLGTTPAGLKLKRSAITVAVVDGTDSPSQTDATVASLKALGYDVISTTSATPTGPISETEVGYSSSAHLNQAQRVLADLSGTVSLGTGPSVDGADVTITTGSSFAVDTPAEASSALTAATSASSSASTTVSLGGGQATLVSYVTNALLASALTTLPSTDGGVLTPATAATENIPWYDPRGCTAAQLKRDGATS